MVKISSPTSFALVAGFLYPFGGGGFALGLQQRHNSFNRRTFVQTVAGGASCSLFWRGQQPAVANDDSLPDLGIINSNSNDAAAVAGPVDEPFQVYKVIPDSSEALNPSVQNLDLPSFLNRVSPGQGGALWLGEHHNSLKDHNVQAKLLQDLFVERQKEGTKVAVGLEQVQVQFQPVLDEFTAGKLSLEELRFLVQWDKRWVWPFENYKEIFITAQRYGIKLLALNVNSEDLSLVERGGLPALPREKLLSYIRDPVGFAQFAASSQFLTYVDYVIRPSYDLHLALGLLKNTMSGEKLDEQMSFRNFYSGRILWDETMAARAFSWTNENPGGLLLGLVGADHVKFRDGIPGRYARMAAGDSTNTAAATAASISVMLNPSLIDTRPSGTVGMMTNSAVRNPDGITLQLRYLKDGITDQTLSSLPSATGGVLPLADYLIFG